MFVTKWSPARPALFVLLLAAVLLSACGARLTNENWPGLIADGDRVYLSFGPGIYAIDVPAREVVWTYPQGFEGRAEIYAPVSILDDLILTGDYGQAGGLLSPGATVTIYALGADAAGTPAEIWTRDDLANDRIIAQPSQSTSVGVVGTADNDVIAIDVRSGQELWRFETGHSIWGQPLYHDGVVYAPSLDKSLYAIEAETGEKLWQATFDGSLASNPVIDEDTIYVGSYDHQLHALDIDTGEIRWSNQAENLVWGSPTLGDGLVFYGDLDGNIYAVSIVGETAGETLWSSRVDGLIQTAPAYHDGVLYVVASQSEGSEEEIFGEVLALDAQDGTVLWNKTTPSPILTSPVVVGNELVVAPLKDSSLLYVYDLEDGSLVWDFIPPSEE